MVCVVRHRGSICRRARTKSWACEYASTDFSGGGAVERHRNADSRHGNRQLQRFELFYVDRALALSDQQVNGFLRMLVQRLEVRLAQPPDVQVRENGLLHGKTGDVEMIPSGAKNEKTRGLKVGEESIRRAGWQTGCFYDLRCCHSARRLAEQAQEMQAALHRIDGISTGRRRLHSGMALETNWLDKKIGPIICPNWQTGKQS